MFAISTGGVRITGNLNEGIGDAGPGTAAAGQSGLPTVAGAYGQVGANVFISTAELVSYTNTAKTNSTLYGGWFKYVLFKATWSATLAIGQMLWYANLTDMFNHTVTADATATSIAAGVALCSTTTKGNYWWIQTEGPVYCLARATVTDKTAGNLLVGTSGTVSTFDGIADATDYPTTALQTKQIYGQWIEAPADGVIKRAYLSPRPIFQ
jgi:hypothetical protein